MPGEKFDAETRRRQILDTTLTIALRDRLEGVSIRTVAREAGVSMGLVSFYFGSKDGLLLALLDEVIARIYTYGFETPDPTAAPMERLLPIVRNTVHLIATRTSDIQLLLDFWLRARQDNAIRERLQLGLAMFRTEATRIAEDLIADDPARFDGITAEALANVTMSVIDGAMFQAVLFPGSLDENTFMQAIRAVVQADAPITRVTLRNDTPTS